MKQLPIRIRLTLWYAGIFTLALVAFGSSVWVLVRERLNDEVQDQLELRVAGVQRFMAAQSSGATLEDMRRALEEEYETEDHAVWLQVLDQDGNWMFRARGMADTFPSPSLPRELSPKGRISTGRDGRFHVLMLQKAVSVQDRLYTIEAGASTNGIHHTLEQLRNVFLFLVPCFVLIAAVGSYYFSRRALRSVDEITAMARSIHERNLNQRLPPLQTNDELQRLSDTLNEMLSRIEAAFTRTRQFTADASHELRTPLSLIRTEAELALRKTRTEEEYRNALGHVLAESERTTELIESLLTLARTDSGAEIIQLVPLQTNTFLRHCTEEWAQVMGEARLRLEVALPSEETWVSADERLLRRLMVVLLDNARKYTPESGYVRVFAELTDREVTVGVQDNGCGIQAEHLPRIFDRFYRVDKARSRGEGGAGLGLSLAKWIAGQHKTEIHVESTPGAGSTFSFRLARVANNTANSASPSLDIENSRVIG
ncbi:periplasmic sensor signal transduction histidine kinase [Candidatus Koribacter versatilis Ellin345]|uniref:histidine kinase n=1 Tax=Koribacter versatilis (strain Ellin345) TaxID=204669 RepID=Q1IUY5_KORVE|nr:ATP-binding protein [Candidatus Koribacter versatilis]ABF39315.1 periplasmic sensor signal transduction histidine kinase [Candidatus Koribacter versatilis Ellin345]